MKRSFLVVSMVFQLIASTGWATSSASNPCADPNASVDTQALLRYLTNLPNNGSSNRVISGQFDGWNGSLTHDIQTIYRKTGKYPGIIGLSLIFGSSDLSGTVKAATYYASSNGGIVDIVGIYHNPVNGNWDNTTAVDLVAAVTPGTATNMGLNNELNRQGAGLLALQSAGVQVILHQLAEMNGNWFWWGTQNSTPESFKNLWIYIFNYYTQTLGLHNILYQYSVNSGLGNATTYYPGPNYVDLAGIDYYSSTDLSDGLSDYNALLTLNKPFTLSEFGPCGPSSPCTNNFIDYSALITSIKNVMPKTVMWLSWNQGWGMADQNNVSTLLNDPWVINSPVKYLFFLSPPKNLRVVE